MKTPHLPLHAVLTILLAVAMPARAESVGVFEDHSDVGGPAKAGAAKYDGAALAYTVTGGGANMWQAKDSFHFVWKKVSGDLTLTANIAFQGKGVEPHRKACLLFRQSLDADSIYADAAVHGDGTVALQHRDAKGAATGEVKANALKDPGRLRLEKAGRTISLLVPGADGGFVSAGKIELELNGPFYVGLGVCAHNDAQLETAVFSNVELKLAAAPAEKSPPGPPKPAEPPPAPNAVFAELEKKVLYHPSPYAAAKIQQFTAKGGRRLNYKTTQGAQSAGLNDIFRRTSADLAKAMSEARR